MPRTGYVAIAGLPNAGKSSLLNAILGTPLAMVSPKAQATRVPTVGIHTEGDVQMILLDLPGLLDPSYLLQQSLRKMALDALRQANVILHLHPAAEAPAPPFLGLVSDAPPFRARVVTVYTKGDLLTPEQRALLAPDASLVATNRPSSIEALLKRVGRMLPEAPFLHDPEEIGTQPVRFFVGEYLREAAFDLLQDEVPYAFAAEVDEFRETPKPVYIRTTLFVERDSQKGILIGHQGETLKKIGSHARKRLEVLLGEPVYLDTWVKVLPKWRRSTAALARFGFPVPEEQVR